MIGCQNSANTTRVPEEGYEHARNSLQQLTNLLALKRLEKSVALNPAKSCIKLVFHLANLFARTSKKRI